MFLPRILISWFSQLILMPSFRLQTGAWFNFRRFEDSSVENFRTLFVSSSAYFPNPNIAPCWSSKPSANLGIHMGRKCWTSFLYCDMQPVRDSNKHDLGNNFLKWSWLTKTQTTLSNCKYLLISISVRFWWSLGKASKSVS